MFLRQEPFVARRRLFLFQIPAIAVLTTIIMVRVASDTPPNGPDFIMSGLLLITVAFAVGNYRLLRTRRQQRLRHGGHHH